MLPLDEALHPPVGIVIRSQPGNRLAGVFQVVKLPLRHGVPDEVFDPRRVGDLPAFLPLLFLSGVELGFFLRSDARAPCGTQLGQPLHFAPKLLGRPAAHRQPPLSALDFALASSIPTVRLPFNGALTGLQAAGPTWGPASSLSWRCPRQELRHGRPLPVRPYLQG